MKAAIFSPREKALLTFIFTSALRPSELLALRWKDINLEKGLMTIRSTFYRGELRPYTKTGEEGEEEHLLIPQTAVLALGEWFGKTKFQGEDDFVFPNSVIVYHPDYVSHLGQFPTGPDETLFIHTMLTPWTPRDAGEEAHWGRSFTLMDGKVFNEEDLDMCEQIQRGIGASAPNDRLVLGWFENNLCRFHDTVAAALT